MRKFGIPIVTALTLGTIVLGGTLFAFSGNALVPSPTEPQVARLVAEIIDHQHYTGTPLDDARSQAWLDNYIDALDPARLYFLDSDIQVFKGFASELDDELMSSEPKIDLAFEVYDRFVVRVGERTTHALATLDGELDLTNEESFTWKRDKAQWPATSEEADEIWRQRIENDVIMGLLPVLPRDSRDAAIEDLAPEVATEDEAPAAEQKSPEELRAEVIERLKTRYGRVQKSISENEPIDVLEIYLSSLTRTYDPHSSYFKPATSDNFDIDMSNAVEGIGASLSVEGMYTTVQAIIPGGPADLDGRLKKGDRIIAVGQASEEAEDVVDQRIDKVVKLIRGKKGTEVRLTVIPKDAADPGATVIYALTRARVELEESDAGKEVREVTVNGVTKKIGIIDVPSFYADFNSDKGAGLDTRKLLIELKNEGVDGIVLDLRGNGGGSLREAVNMAGLFVKSGPMVQVRMKDGNVEKLNDPDGGVVYDGPLVVMVDPLSASASEIVAGAVQDYGRGVVVGSAKTHGKGTVQVVLGLTDMLQRMQRVRFEEDVAGALKLTVQKFYRVSGGSTQNRGVESDIVLPSPWDGLDMYESDLDNAMPWDEIPAARYTPAGTLAPVLPELKMRSTTRVSNSSDFERITKDVSTRVAAESDSVSLVLADRLKEVTERSRDADDLPEDWDPILDEGVAVLGDLIELQSAQAAAPDGKRGKRDKR